MPGFHPGGIKDRVDLRDHKWSEVGFGSAPFDWSGLGYSVEDELRLKLNNPSFKIPVKNQDGSGSCGGQAWSYYGGSLEALYTGSFEERSAKFIYAQTYVPGGGSAGRENSNIAIKQGWAKEAVLPSYDGGNPPSEAFMERSGDITDVVRQDAVNAKAASYADVNQDIDTIAQAVRDNHGVIIGVVGSNNATWYSIFPAPPTMAESRWYHWLYAGKARMINGKKHIGVLNSWGPVVGENGWQWISEDYINAILLGDVYGKAIWSVWAMVYNTVIVPPTFTHNFSVNIAFSQSGNEVSALQKALQLDGEFPLGVPPTGYFGDITRRAVLAFQIKYQLDTPAVLNLLAGKSVGPKTRTKLNELFNK